MTNNNTKEDIKEEIIWGDLADECSLSHMDYEWLHKVIDKAYESGKKQERQRIAQELEEMTTDYTGDSAIVAGYREALDDVKELLDEGLHSE